MAKENRSKKYGRINDVIRDYSIGRTTLNKWISQKKVKSYLLKDKGAVRGLRLVDLKSLDKLITGSSEKNN